MLRVLLCCREDRSYIITGGLGGFGLALAVWLSNQGAKNLVMTSKRGMRTGSQRKVIEMLRSRGVNVSARSLPLFSRHVPPLMLPRSAEVEHARESSVALSCVQPTLYGQRL